MRVDKIKHFWVGWVVGFASTLGGDYRWGVGTPAIAGYGYELYQLVRCKLDEEYKGHPEWDDGHATTVGGLAGTITAGAFKWALVVS